MVTSRAGGTTITLPSIAPSGRAAARWAIAGPRSAPDSRPQTP